VKELTSFHWPGNVRELEKFVEYIFVLYDEVNNDVIIEELNKKKSGCNITKLNNMSSLLANSNFFDAISEFEKHYIKHQLILNNSKVSSTALKIGLERTTLYKKIKKYGL